MKLNAARSVVAIVFMGIVASGCGQFRNSAIPLCDVRDRNASSLILMAQAVPSAAYVPCISEFPAGWSYGGERLRNGRPEFWLDSDRAGFRAVTVTLTRSCDTSDAVEVPIETGEPQMERYEEPDSLLPAISGRRYYVFPGGCVTYGFAFLHGATFAQVVEASEALTFISRAEGSALLAKNGLILCGRDVRCPG